MKFEARYPENAILKKYIQYYYFVQTNEKGHYSRYYSFPNITLPINIHKNVAVEIDGNKVRIKENATNSPIAIANGMRESPLLVEWSGCLDKITIAFKPGGINAFINRPLEKIVKGYGSIFTEWSSEPGYAAYLETFYKGSDIDKRLIVTEAFLLSICKPFDKEDLIFKAIELLSNFTYEKPISQVAAELDIAERSFNRAFKSLIGISPVGFRKIARFRQSLENKVVKDKFKRLIDIGYESNYYDQAYYVKMYKKLSGKNPSGLYRAIDKLADDNVIFEFLEKSIDPG